MNEIKYKIGRFLVDLVKELVNDMEIKGCVYEHTYRIWVENRYVQVVPEGLSRNLHFEFWRDHWAFHFEGIDYDAQANELYTYFKQQRLGKDNVIAWDDSQYIKELRMCNDVGSISEFIDQFKTLYNMLNPYINEYLKRKALENDVDCISIEGDGEDVRKDGVKGTQYKDVEAKVRSIQDILKENLRIPDYQRPYVWEPTNVIQLLNDINESLLAKKEHYRIGSLILHYNKEAGTLDIVDGQQRITTLLLTYRVCVYQGTTDSDENIRIRNLKYNHIDSFTHIKQNRDCVSDWFEHNNVDTRGFWDYIRKSCEMVQIVVTDLSEAFQMFDTQNGRGKSLEAYNLLKAFHIRAMEQNSREEKIECDKRWEAATLYDATPTIKDDPNIDVLKHLFDEQLYRSRVWSRNNEAWNFSNAKIGEFKGITIDKNHEPSYPYQSRMLLQYLTSKFYTGVIEGVVKMPSRFVEGDGERINPFVTINQDIVNGRDFFEYVETYTEIYKQLFLNLGTYNLQGFKRFFVSHCLNYDDAEQDQDLRDPYCFKAKKKACRSGDTYLRELYKSLLFVTFDRFGENGLNQAYIYLYNIVYIQRLIKEKVTYAAVAKLPHTYFKAIMRAKDTTELDMNLQHIWTNLQQQHEELINKLRIANKERKEKLPRRIVEEIVNSKTKNDERKES